MRILGTRDKLVAVTIEFVSCGNPAAMITKGIQRNQMEREVHPKAVEKGEDLIQLIAPSDDERKFRILRQYNLRQQCRE